tara:strand:- start:235 stop:855 length:621 start_codon:yes stop_codon:yes gene_type:complete
MNRKKKIAIINYKAGNIFSISNSLKYLGYDVHIANSPNELKTFDYLIIPGVGSYGYCLSNLKKFNFYNLLKKIFKYEKIPCLCICVGLQILGQSSEENMEEIGLQKFDFKIKKLLGDSENKIPHVGWNDVKFINKFEDFQTKTNYDFYFDHSYALYSCKNAIAYTNHSKKFVPILKYKNILACQFHPEKSQENGLMFLKSFISYYG